MEREKKKKKKEKKKYLDWAVGRQFSGCKVSKQTNT
jgi:hypothetical protein